MGFGVIRFPGFLLLQRMRKSTSFAPTSLSHMKEEGRREKKDCPFLLILLVLCHDGVSQICQFCSTLLRSVFKIGLVAKRYNQEHIQDVNPTDTQRSGIRVLRIVFHIYHKYILLFYKRTFLISMDADVMDP